MRTITNGTLRSFSFQPRTSQTWSVYDYDLLVIGSGPGGQKAAIAAAKLDLRVAVVERPQMLGGVCVNTGTIPSKTLREAILYLTGIDQREIYGQAYRVKDEITVADLTARTSHVVSRENDVVRSQLARNRVTIIQGLGYFVGPHAVEVDDGGGRIRKVTADKIVIATGTKPARPASVAFDERTIIDSDGMNHLDRVPRSMVVVGAGVIGMEYASMFAALGTKVTVVEKRTTDARVLRRGGRRGAQVPPAGPRRDVPLRRDASRRWRRTPRARSRCWAAARRSPPTPSCTARAARA